MEITIRSGIKSDLPSILALIKELAVYEKAGNEVVVTLEQLEEDGFGSSKVFDFLVAENQQQIIGMALFYTKYSTWKGKCIYLEDIIVQEQHRGMGIGKKLMKELISIAAERNAGRLEWQVLDWNEPAIHFYKSINALLDNEWVNCKLNNDQLKRMANEGI